VSKSVTGAIVRVLEAAPSKTIHPPTRCRIFIVALLNLLAAHYAFSYPVLVAHAYISPGSSR